MTPTTRAALLTATAAVCVGAAAAASGVIDPTGNPESPANAAQTLRQIDRGVLAAERKPPVEWGWTKAPRSHRVTPNLGGLPAAGILVDASTGMVMWSRNAGMRRPVASLTKMMNALVAIDLADPDRQIRISRTAAGMGGSVVGGLPAGGSMRVGTLLRGMLIVSGNDAANALADGLGPGRARFVDRMNARARAMHLRCTSFTSPEGLGTGNRSCARDLALIARALLANPSLRSTVAKSWDSIVLAGKGRRLLRNRNPLMQRGYPGVTGVKTGHTAPAGWCLVASATRGSHRLISVMLGSDERAWQSQRLLDAGFRALRR